MHRIPSLILEEPSESSVSDVSDESVVEKNTPVQPAKPKHYLISIIADEDTCVGFILGGIGELTANQEPNYFVVDSHTTDQEIEDAYQNFLSRKDIGIILITRANACRIHSPHKTCKVLPAVIEIPDKNGPYTIDIDHLLNLATYHDKVREDKINYLKEKRGF